MKVLFYYKYEKFHKFQKRVSGIQSQSRDLKAFSKARFICFLLHDFSKMIYKLQDLLFGKGGWGENS